MATYGKGQMLGAGIDPRMFVQDFSGFTKAAETKANAITDLSKQISTAITDRAKEQSEQEKEVKKSELIAKAVSAKYPELAPMAQEAMYIMSDKNVPLKDRYAAAQAVDSVLNMGIKSFYQDREYGLQTQAREADLIKAEAARERAISDAGAMKTETTTMNINGQPVDVTYSVDKQGRRYSYQTGQPISSMNDYALGKEGGGINGAGEIPIEAPSGATIAPPEGFDNANPSVLPLPQGEGGISANTVLTDKNTASRPSYVVPKPEKQKRSNWKQNVEFNGMKGQYDETTNRFVPYPTASTDKQTSTEERISIIKQARELARAKDFSQASDLLMAIGVKTDYGPLNAEEVKDYFAEPEKVDAPITETPVKDASPENDRQKSLLDILKK